MQLFISNLGHQVTEESLHAVFAAHGSVSSAQILKDQQTALVVMPLDQEAFSAMKKINGSVINGKSLSVQQQPPTA